MTVHIEAVYEKGVLRPLEPLPLGELERVQVTVTNETGLTGRESFEELARELTAAGPVPTLAQVREMLAHDKSSWSDAVVAERQERGAEPQKRWAEPQKRWAEPQKRWAERQEPWRVASYYFDSSALVKLYHPEAGSETVDAIYQRDENRLVVSSLTT